MSETLRDLVVSLSLQTDNFTRNIKSVNKQIAEAESKFKLAAAGLEGFEKTTTGLANKLTTLDRRLELQKNAVTQYERALEAADLKLHECVERQRDYAQRLTDAKTAQQNLKTQVATAAQKYREYASTLGETNEKTVAAKERLDALKEKYRASVQEVKKLTGQNTALKKTTQNAADAFTQAGTNLNMARAVVKNIEAEIAKCNKSLALAQTNWDAAGDAIDESCTAISTFGKQISLAESKFKLATVGIKEMDSSVTGLSAKLTLLKEKLSLQQRSVEQYEKALRGAREQLRAAQQAGDPEKIQQASDAVIDAEAALYRAKAAVRETALEIQNTNRQLKTAQSAWTAAGRSLESFGKTCNTVSRGLNTAGRTLTTTLTTPIVALGTAAVKASLDFESSFASVRKTVDATEEEFAGLAAASNQMSTKIATSTSEINEVMATGGQLGIANQYLTDFTRTMIDLGNSCEDLDANDAAATIAKFVNVMGTNQSLFSNIGSTIVALGNNFATTERPIMEMAQRLAGAGKQVGLTEAQVLGFATALSSVGIEAQMGGTALSKALIKMEVACVSGGEALDDFAKVCGLTADQFKVLFEADPAAAFQAFIVGLAQLDEEGESAIAVLNDIGIKEVRLRDTLLRSVNATELFASAQAMANQAWEENTALTTEANKRYATTASRLTNLKNKAVLFAQQLGDDLNPTIQNLINGADELLDKFLEMDEAQRKQIIQYAAYAATGPVLLALGKITKGISVVATGIGKFATAVGKAGGGFKGFLSVLGKSPAVWLTVAAGVITGTIALADYVSGAKQAREALEGMSDTAQKWKDTAAEIFYGNSDGLSFFGMSQSDFARNTQSARQWMEGVIAVWSDGQKDTDEIVAHWTDSFKALTASTREELEQMRSEAQSSGYDSVVDELSRDIETLDSMDAEIERLLRKRQNGYLTDADKVRLQELIDTREAIEIKYNLSPADVDGFDTIRKKLDAEIARAQALGKEDASTAVYENAMVAAAEGLAAINQQLDAEYDKEYALIQLIEDATERQAAMDALNAKYTADRRNAALEYAALLADVVLPVWQQEDIQQAASDVEALTLKLREYSAAAEADKPAILADLNELTAAMDEGALTEYISMLTQIQSLMDSGMSEGDIQAMFPEIDFSTALEQIAAIQGFLNNRELDLPGLNAMFGEAVPEEVLKIATDLDMTGAQERWNTFAANPGAITTDAIIASISENEQTVKVQPQVDAFISKYTEIPEGADKTTLTPDGIVAFVTSFAEVTTGADVSGLNPTNVTAMVTAYNELASGVDITTLKPSEITAYISKYLESEGVDTTSLTPDAITAFVLAYQEITGGALTTSLAPSDITAMVARYLEAEGVDMSALSPDQIEAIVSSFAEATGCDKSTLLQDFTAYIVKYDDTNAVKPKLEMTVGIYGYDMMAYRKFVQENPVEVQGIVKLGEAYENPSDALTDTNAKFWQDGVEVPVHAVPTEMLTANKVAVLAEDGTMHILITPEITGTQEAIDAISPVIDEVDQLGVTTAGAWAGLVPTTTMDMVGSAVERINSYTKTLDYSSWDKFWASLRGESTDKNVLHQSMQLDFGPERVAELSAYVGEVVAAIQQGQQVSEQDLNNLQEILTFLQGLDTTGVGTHISEGVAEGMTAAGWSADAETVASQLEAALNAAFIIQSPSARMKPIGKNAAAGVGVGLTEYSPAPAASALATAIYTAVAAQLNASTLRPVGLNAMRGLTAGINAGRSGVISAMRSAARAAVNAAKAQLKVRSPSQVFKQEVGVMAMRGFGEGVLEETKAQARIIRNAARFLTGEARESSISTTSNDNRRTYNSNVHSTIQVQQMVVRDEQDIRSLAIEIAAITRQQQRGRGLRMA